MPNDADAAHKELIGARPCPQPGPHPVQELGPPASAGSRSPTRGGAILNPKEIAARIEARYTEQTEAINEWGIQQHEAINVEWALRHTQARAERDRDFQAHGLTKDGTAFVQDHAQGGKDG